MLRDDFEGSWDVFFERLSEAEAIRLRHASRPSRIYGYAACYSPDPERPGKALLPFEIETGALVDDVWEQWLAVDPVRMAPGHADALRSMRRIYLDAGKADEYYLDLGATGVLPRARQARRRALARALRRQARRHRLALPRRRPRAGAGAVVTRLKPENATSPADYLRQIDEPRRSDVEAVDRLIREEAPQLRAPSDLRHARLRQLPLPLRAPGARGIGS